MKATHGVLADYAKTAAPVEAFCAQQGLTDYAMLAVDLVKECFDLAGPPTLDVDIDDETSDEHLIVEFTARGGVDAVLASDDRLIKSWVQAVPWPQRLMVRFYYNITE